VDDLSDFLAGLHCQLERCAAAAASGEETRHSSVWRIAAYGMVCLAAAAVVLGIVFWPRDRGPIHTGRSGGTSAIVLAVPTGGQRALTDNARTRAGKVPNPGYVLLDAAARSEDDVWAAGFLSTVDASTGNESIHSVILHWDGHVWRQVSAPDVGAVRAIALDAQGGVWAVAWSPGQKPRQHVLHWDGHEWSDLVLPVGAGLMSDLVAFSSDDVWAVGAKTGPLVTRGTYGWNPEHVRLVHWNGTTWTTVAAPAGAQRGFLRSVSGTSSVDVWAVGRRDRRGGRAAGTLVLHWDGSAWSRIPSAPTGAPWLVTVAAISPTDVWAGGEDLLQHWDGRSWRRTPHDFQIYSQLAALSADEIWLATGNRGVVHWDGRGWHSFSLRDMGLTSANIPPTIDAVTPVSARSVWAFGRIWQRRRNDPRSSWAPSLPLILHWDGSTWRIVVDSVVVQ